MLIILITSSLVTCNGQPYSFKLSHEQIEPKGTSWQGLLQYYDNKLLAGIADLSGNTVKFWLYDEFSKSSKVIDSLTLYNQKVASGYKIDNLLILNGYFSIPPLYGQISFDDLPYSEFKYQDRWAYINGKGYLIKSFPFAYSDKGIQSKISGDKKYLIFNPYEADMYMNYQASPEDNVIYLYDLEKVKQGIIKEDSIPCEYCYNTFEMNDTLIFGKEFIYTERSIEFTYSNIYKAPVNNINDTVLIARDITLLNVSPDGRYIVGRKKLRGKEFTVILDVQTHCYQYIVGRNYHYDQCFYSLQEQKFAFAFDKHLVYINFPDEYPYDAMIPYKPDWSTKEEDALFWKEHKVEEHKPLK
jgi:hypothetical protein